MAVAMARDAAIFMVTGDGSDLETVNRKLKKVMCHPKTDKVALR